MSDEIIKTIADIISKNQWLLDDPSYHEGVAQEIYEKLREKYAILETN